MSFTPITNHFEQAQTRFLGQYSADPRWTGLVAGLMAPIQTLEDTIASLPASLRLKTATGQSLDDIGAFIGLARNGTTDETYRLLLMGQIIEDRSDGTIDSVSTAAKALFGAQAVFLKSSANELDPLTMSVSFAIGTAQVPAALYGLCVGILSKAVAASVTVGYVSLFNATSAFSCAGPQAWVGGFADIDGTKGAPFAGLLPR